MALFYSTECEYGLRALIHLARQKGDTPLTTAEIADGAEIPRYFLAKILQRLSAKRLLVSIKGPGGGFRLARVPHKISALDIVDAIDGVETLQNACVLGIDICTDEAMCPFHTTWKTFRAEMLRTFEKLTLQDLARELEKKRRWLQEKDRK